ncbi:MAG: RrF2 family transcriptional regulator [Ktedonobacterales bacterium]
MRVTMKSDYGLRAMIDLAAHYGQGPVPSALIAERQLVPEHFLDQLLISLRRAGLLKSLRGPQGGHMLARPPQQISMSDVIQALDGSTAPMECLPNPAVCQLAPGCAIRVVWWEVERFAQQLLASTTLDQLAANHRVAGDSDELMYYI